jgi:hypothetical protein
LPVLSFLGKSPLRRARFFSPFSEDSDGFPRLGEFGTAGELLRDLVVDCALTLRFPFESAVPRAVCVPVVRVDNVGAEREEDGRDGPATGSGGGKGSIRLAGGDDRRNEEGRGSTGFEADDGYEGGQTCGISK